MNQLLERTALELGADIRRGEVSVEEAVCATLCGAGADNAFITLAAEQALERARVLQKNVGAAQSPLFGVPMTLKDNICTRGMKTTCGSKMLAEYCSPYDAAVAERLDAVGAVCLGKTNLDEFGMGSTCETSWFGAVHNPWCADRSAGGSSGGAAAAVARGAGWFALGSDTGGSVRLPAAWCGVTGIKPTYGTVSRYGLVAYASSFDQIGALCRDAADCAAVLDVIQGQDARDGTSVPGNYGGLLQTLTGDLRGLRIGLPVQCFEGGLDAQVRGAVLKVADVLRHRGAVVEECALPTMKAALHAYYVLACAQASSNLARYDGVRFGYRAQGCATPEELYKKSRSEGFGAEVKRRILLGTFVLSADCYESCYKKALAVKEQVKAEFDRLFERYDLLLTPVSPGTPPELGTSLLDPARMWLQDMYTVCVNLAGLPAMSVPCGQDADGLPIGAQLIGPTFGEGVLLRAAYGFQQETDHHKKRPSGFGEGGGPV